MTKIYGSKEVCKKLGINIRRLDYLQFYGKIPHAKIKIGQTRVYTDEELEIIKKVEIKTRKKMTS